nr:HNH endonuclease signature motif containing protein [Enterococcus gallinarum]
MELWRKVRDYENYEISTHGRVMNTCRNKLLAPNKNTWGYLGVFLYKNGVEKRFQIHRLVAQAFLENPLEKNEVNHIDGDKTNNCITNLEWVTRSENMKHAHQNNLMDISKAYKMSSKTQGIKLTVFDKKSGIKKTFKNGAEASKYFGHSLSYFSKLITKQNGVNRRFIASYEIELEEQK